MAKRSPSKGEIGDGQATTQRREREVDAEGGEVVAIAFGAGRLNGQLARNLHAQKNEAGALAKE